VGERRSHAGKQGTPSEADIRITRDLIRAGQLLKIEVLDHIVVGNPNHTSLRSLGCFLALNKPPGSRPGGFCLPVAGESGTGFFMEPVLLLVPLLAAGIILCLKESASDSKHHSGYRPGRGKRWRPGVSAPSADPDSAGAIMGTLVFGGLLFFMVVFLCLLAVLYAMAPAMPLW
jgi:DNA repair protein RadC